MTAMMPSFLDFVKKHDSSSLLKEHCWKLLGASAVGYSAYKIWKWPRNLPPGPRNWPIQTAIKNPAAWHLDFMRLGDKYGDVFSFYYGNKYAFFSWKPWTLFSLGNLGH